MALDSLPESLVDELETQLDDGIDSHAAVGGGCIANGGRIEVGEQSYFLKWGDPDVARTFPGEAAGLEALAAAESPLVVPAVEVTAAPSDDRPGFLVLEWINSGRKGLKFWENFGEGLAELHRSTGDRYGFEQDNFIGRLPQQNTWEQSWPRFFRAHRLEPQVRMAREQGRWQDDWSAPLEALYRRLPDLLPEDPPASILHGDLWSGNFMVAAVGTAVLIDPAAYYGHREADLAMSELFGGFDERFYDAYAAAWPLESGYETRREIYNLYHLINHLNHFGGGYASSVDSILKSFA